MVGCGAKALRLDGFGEFGFCGVGAAGRQRVNALHGSGTQAAAQNIPTIESLTNRSFNRLVATTNFLFTIPRQPQPPSNTTNELLPIAISTTT